MCSYNYSIIFLSRSENLCKLEFEGQLPLFRLLFLLSSYIYCPTLSYSIHFTLPRCRYFWIHYLQNPFFDEILYSDVWAQYTKLFLLLSFPFLSFPFLSFPFLSVRFDQYEGYLYNMICVCFSYKYAYIIFTHIYD